jgi:hypothetical protein
MKGKALEGTRRGESMYWAVTVYLLLRLLRVTSTVYARVVIRLAVTENDLYRKSYLT